MQKKNPAKRRPERLVVTLLSLLFLSTAVFATVKYVFRAPELDTDKPVVTPDGTARRMSLYPSFSISSFPAARSGAISILSIRNFPPNSKPYV